MLELPSLLIKPWLYTSATDWPKPGGLGTGWLRTIVDPTTERAFGYAAWDTLGTSAWLAWLGRKKIQVFESDDESLLMTVVRPWAWSRTWEIGDAEERLVGQFCHGALYDGWGGRLASVGMNAEGTETVLRGDDGDVLGAWQEMPGQGCYFRFGASIDQNPFVRMAVLAGVLTLPPWPGDVSLVIP